MSVRKPSGPATVKVLVVGQTPPPYHGQAITLARLVASPMDRVELYHVRMAFSTSMDDVGRLRPGKLWHLMGLVGRILWLGASRRFDILYYPPAGPNRIPMGRDIALLLATRWLFRKTIFHMYAAGLSDLYPRLGAPARWLYRRAYYYPDAVVRIAAGTPEDGRALHARHEFIVPNPADDGSQTLGPNRAAPARRNRATHLLYVGTVCRSKGVLVLLDACRRLRDRGVEARLCVVGSFQPAAFETDVRQAIRDRGLDGSVVLCGQLTGDKKWDRFREADIFCFPTFFESEALPCVVLEAMTFGLPVVTTRWRGLPSVIDHGSNGFLTKIGDAEAVATHLERLSTDPELRARMGAAGRAKYLREYTTARFIERMAHVFATVAHDPSPAPEGSR